MNRTDLAKAISARVDVPSSKITSIILAMEDVILEEVHKGTKVSLPGFVSFEKSERDARTYRNPRTGEPIEAGPTSYVKISALHKIKSLFKA